MMTFAKKLKLITFLLLSYFSFGMAQECVVTATETLHANYIKTSYVAGPFMFDGNNDVGFLVPFTGGDDASTIFTSATWLGGFDPGGNLKVNANTYAYVSEMYEPKTGPLDNNGNAIFPNCEVFNHIWKVNRYQIESLLADLDDNGMIDEVHVALRQWPGKGNPYFSDFYGVELPDQNLAPFHDQNNDGIYNIMDGDYPLPEEANSSLVPAEILWSVYHDVDGGVLNESTTALGIETQLTVWAYHCTDNDLANHMVFSSQKIINRSPIAYHDFVFSNWTDSDLGCAFDDYFGCIPEKNTFYFYNSDNTDGENGSDCNQTNTYGNNPPVQSVTILNKEMDSFMYYMSAFSSPPPGMTDPQNAIEYYNYMTSKWRDGTPMTFGGNGYDPASLFITNFAFPESPNINNTWSMFNEGLSNTDRRTVANISIGQFESGQIETITSAHAYHRQSGFNHLQNTDLMNGQIDAIQDWYDAGLTDLICNQSSCENDCIWPGDTNYDGIVGPHDILPVGLKLNDTGVPRNLPITWTPQTGFDWFGELNGIDLKHIDCNGNGIIEESDGSVVQSFINNMHSNYSFNVNYPQGAELFVDGFAIGADFESMTTSKNLLMNANIIDIEDLYGFAFTLEYDPLYFKTPTTPFALGDFVNGDQYIEVLGSSDFGNKKGIHCGFIKTAEMNQTDAGQLFGFNLKTKSAYPDPLPSYTTKLKFANVVAVRADGSTIDIGGTSFEITFVDIEVATTELEKDLDLSIFPNPVKDHLQITTKYSQIESIEIFNSLGRKIHEEHSVSGTTNEFSMSSFGSGIYFVKIKVNGKYLTKKIVVIK